MKRAYQFLEIPFHTVAARLSVFAFSLLLSTVAFCQSAITLTSANTPLTASAYTLDTLSSWSSPTTGANQTWNEGSGVFVSHFGDPLLRSTNPVYSSSAVYDTLGFEPIVDTENIVYGLAYREFFDLGSNSITMPGISFPSEAYNIGELSMTPTDSLWVSPQDDLYSTPLTYLEFPATMGSTWSTTNAKQTVDMRVKVALLAGDTDFKKVSYFTTTDTVVGWGMLTLPSQSATPVLMVKVILSRLDSFYLNDGPVSDFILGVFHVVPQGTVSSDYSYQFFAQGSILPLLSIGYADPAYTEPTTAVSYQAAASGVTEIAPSGDIHIYPNPSRSESFFIQSDSPLSAGDQLEVYDVSGKRIVLEPLSSGVSNGIIPVSLPSETAPGTHMVRILGANNQLIQQTKLSILP